MASDLNRVSLIGRLGKDPEVRHNSNGSMIVTFSLATGDSWKDKATGERKERTEWHNIVVFNEGLGKVIEQYCRKGSQIYIEGQLATRKWQDQSGNDRYTTEVVLRAYGGTIQLLGESGGSKRPSPPASSDEYGKAKTGFGQATTGTAPATTTSHLDDDIPF